MRGAVLLVAAAVIVVACGSSPGASGAAAGNLPTDAAGAGGPTPVVPTAVAPTLVPGAVTAPPVVAGALELTAVNIDFEPKELATSAGPVVITFHNEDSGVPHNVEVKDAGGTSVYQGEILIGPVVTQESIGDLAAGAYTYLCTVHPTMQGTLQVLP